MTKELESKILEAKKAYYNDSNPIMTDDEFDLLVDQLRELDPTNRILSLTGSDIKDKKTWPVKQLTTRMGSQNKINSLEQVDEWMTGRGYTTFERTEDVTEEEIELLKKWDSVWASVWASVRDSVWDSVWASVWAYISSIFPNIKKWKYIDHEEGVNPFQPCIDLWRAGLVPSYDGKTWRLHSGKDAKVVYEERSKK